MRNHPRLAFLVCLVLPCCVIFGAALALSYPG